MQIKTSPLFDKKLDLLLEYIGESHPRNALNFAKSLKKEVQKLGHFPYKFRKSIYFEQDNIRDLIFKGYTIPYLIEEDRIVVLNIIKWQSE